MLKMVISPSTKYIYLPSLSKALFGWKNQSILILYFFMVQTKKKCYKSNDYTKVERCNLYNLYELSEL